MSCCGKTANAAAAAGRVVAAFISGEKIAASPTTKMERLAICQQCPHLKQSKLGKQCLICGCWLEAKAFLETENCPMKKW